jgi:imidazoleglycerol-phosphate dehydratase
LKRQATISRKTKETQIAATVDLDGSGAFDVKSGIGFLDHMFGTAGSAFNDRYYSDSHR